MTGDIEDAIWADIDRAGIQLELRVASLLSKRNWGAGIHPHYLDYDEDKVREFDVSAFRSQELDTEFSTTKNYSLDFRVHLLLECKKIPGNAWTFFIPHDEDLRKKYRSSFDEGNGAAVAIHSFPGGRYDWTGFDPFNQILRKEKHADVITDVYHESILDKKKSNKRDDNIFEASITIAKALEYYRDEALKEQAEAWRQYVAELLGFKTAEATRRFLLEQNLFDGYKVFQPLIVFEGELNVAEMGTRKMRSANVVRLLVNYESSKYKISNCQVDICHVDYLGEYIDTMAQALEEFSEEATKPQRLPERMKIWTNEGYMGKPYDHEKSWLENMRIDLIDRLGKAVESHDSDVNELGRIPESEN